MIFDNKKKGGGSHRVVAQGDEGNGKISFMGFFSLLFALSPPPKKVLWYTILVTMMLHLSMNL